MYRYTYVQLRRFSHGEEGQPWFTLDVGNAVAQMMAGSGGTVHAPVLVLNRGCALGKGRKGVLGGNFGHWDLKIPSRSHERDSDFRFLLGQLCPKL